MSTIQIKTLELLIIRELRGLNGYNEKAHSAFTQILHHFSNEEYLYGVEHTEIITKIYIHNFYKSHSTEALSRELHIDVKMLLMYRKAYVRLFAKHYLDLSAPTKTDLLFLYDRLKKEEKAAGECKPSPRQPLNPT